MLGANSRRRAILRTLLWGLLLAYPADSTPQTATLQERVSEKVLLRNLSEEGTNISGEVLNKSPVTIRDVQVLIRYVWHWENEFQPGPEDPGAAMYHTVRKEIPPNKATSFRYALSPPAARPDGHFETEVSIAGFSEVIPR